MRDRTQFLNENRDLSIQEFSEKYLKMFGTPPSAYYLTKKEGHMNKKKPPKVEELVHEDRKVRQLTEKERVASQKYNALLKHVETVERELDVVRRLAVPSVNYVHKAHKGAKGDGESACVVLASDWHIEEAISPDAVNGSPGYSLDIAKKRAVEFFETALLLRNLEAKNTPVPTMYLCLLGDFITGNLHRWHGTEKNTTLEPTEAAWVAYGMLKGGIDFLLKESDLNLVIPCHVGNHARITAKSEDSEHENGNSLEYLIYCFLAEQYKGNKRVKFLISKSYASRLQIFDVVLRLHHGHRMKFGGGIGGLAVPASKYVLRKNTHWAADYDCFGHFHQKQMGPRFLCNGSMIGYNAHASDGAFEYQGPSQTYFLINKKRKEIIDYRPILFSI